MTTTKNKQRELLAEKFVRAGNCEPDSEITREDFVGTGLDWPDQIHSWFDFCGQIYKQITGEKHPGSPYRGTGSRSKDYGDKVSEAIKAMKD